MVDPRGISSATLEFMRDTSRRFASDLQDMKSDLSRECRGMGREIRGLGAKVRGGTKGLARLELPRLVFANSNTSTKTASSGYQELSQSPRMGRMYEDDDDPLWSSGEAPLPNEFNSPAATDSPVSFSPLLLRSPKTEEILKNIGDTFQKTDKAVRDMLGLETKKAVSDFKTPVPRELSTFHRISAPAPPSSPASNAPIFSLDD